METRMGNKLATDAAAELAAVTLDQARAPAAPADAVEKKSYTGFLKNNIRDYGMLLSLIVIMGFFQYMTDGTLLEPLNLTNLVLQNSYVVIMALGMLWSSWPAISTCRSVPSLASS